MKKIMNYCLMLLISLLLSNCNGGNSSSNNSEILISPPPAVVTVSLDADGGGVAQGASNISLTPIFSLKFSAAIDPASIDNTKIILAPDPTPTSSAIAISNFTLNPEHTSVSFTPSVPLQPLATYYLSVKRDVKTYDGRTLQANQFTFTTGDYTLPMVVVSPHNNQTNIATSPSIVAQFSKAVTNVNARTVTLYEGSTSGTPIAISINQGDADHYIITPTHPLKDKTEYYLSFSNAIVDQQDNNLAAITIKFTTGDENAPSVALLNILNGATNVTSNNTSIILQFSEEVVNVNSNTITLHEDSINGRQVAIYVTRLGNNQYELKPQVGYLKRQTNYHIRVSSTITDLVNHHLPSTTFNFTTRTGYLYLLNYSSENIKSNIVKCPINQNDNKIINNKCAQIITLNGARRMTMNKKGSVAYISTEGNNSLAICAVHESDGSFSCHIPTLNLQPIGPTGIALSKSERHLFIANSKKTPIDGLFTTCTLDDNGLLVAGSCVSGPIQLPPPYQTAKIYTLSLNKAGTQLYLIPIYNFQEPIITCQFDGESLASLQDCKNAHLTHYHEPSEIVFNRQENFAYFALHTNPSASYFCAVKYNWTIPTCTPFSDVSFATSVALSADGLNLYLTSRYYSLKADSNKLYIYNIDQVSGQPKDGKDIKTGDYIGQVYLRY